MPIKFLHLNMFNEATFLKEIIAFITQHDFDIINLQEVAFGSISNQQDVYQILQTALPQYKSTFVNAIDLIGEPEAYFGNAIFYKSSFVTKSENTIWFQDMSPVPGLTPEYADKLGRNATHLVLEKEGKTLHVINTHLTRGPNPNDEPYKLKQGKTLFTYMKEHVQDPFLFSGDFNVTPDSQIVQWFNTMGRNLTVENHVKNTLNPRVHRVKSLFPEGLAVDYIYVSNDMLVSDFHVIEEDLSDHLGLSLSCRI